jgi:hypothetical protein
VPAEGMREACSQRVWENSAYVPPGSATSHYCTVSLSNSDVVRYVLKVKQKGKATPVTGRGGL